MINNITRSSSSRDLSQEIRDQVQIDNNNRYSLRSGSNIHPRPHILRELSKQNHNIGFLANLNMDETDILENREKEQQDQINEEAEEEIVELFQEIQLIDKIWIEIPLEELPKESLLLAPSVTFIPPEYLPKARKVFNKYAELIIEDPTNIMNWKKYLSLNIILFTDIEGSRRETLKERIDDALRDDWSKITLNKLKARRVVSGSSLVFRDMTIETDTHNKKKAAANKVEVSAWDKRIEQLACNGEIGKIMRMIDREGTTKAVDEDTVERLQQKFPSPYSLMDQEFLSVPPCDEAAAIMGVTADNIRGYITSRANGIKDGHDKDRYELKKKLIGIGGEDHIEENKYAEGLAAVVSLILNGKAPFEVYSYLRSCELIALSKPDKPGDVRPVNQGCVIRKLTSLFIKDYTKKASSAAVIPEQRRPFNESHFEGKQYGLEKLGTEKIIHSLRIHREKNVEDDTFIMDATNAFCNSSRSIGLNEVKKHMPIALPFISRMYGPDSKGLVVIKEEKDDNSVNVVRDVTASEGWFQGDVLGSWLYCLTNHGLILEVQQAIDDFNNRRSRDVTFFKFFIDDGNAAAKFELMCIIIAILIERGPVYGFYISFTKGTYMIGPCETDDEAERRKQILISRFGFSSDMIRFHPSNGGDPLLYGAKVLGSFIGTDEFCRSELEKKMCKLEISAKNIIKKVSQKQIQYLLLKWCYTQKIIHIQRTTPSDLVNSVLEGPYTDTKMEIMAHILECTTDELKGKFGKIVSLHCSDGGLGVMNSKNISHSAYIASMIECDSTIKSSLGISITEAKDLNLPSINVLYSSIDQFNEFTGLEFTIEDMFGLQGSIEKGKTLQSVISEYYRPVFKKEVMDLLVTTKEVAHILSASHIDTALWIDIAPKSNWHKMTNVEFVVALRLRILMPQKSIVPYSRCTCKKTVDEHGFHQITGCGHGGNRTITHDLVTRQIQNILNYCGCTTKWAEIGCFHGTDPNNNKKPDLTVYNMVGSGNMPVLLDTMISCTSAPSGGTALTMQKAKQEKRAATEAENTKKILEKYKVVAPANGFAFRPTTFEETGRMGNELETILKANLKHAAEVRMIPFTNLWRYWVSSLMVVLHRSIANGILRRSVAINGKFVEDWTNDKFAMLEFDNVLTTRFAGDRGGDD